MFYIKCTENTKSISISMTKLGINYVFNLIFKLDLVNSSMELCKTFPVIKVHLIINFFYKTYDKC